MNADFPCDRAGVDLKPQVSKKLAVKNYSQSWQKHLATLELHSGVMSRGRSNLRKLGLSKLIFSYGTFRAEISGPDQMRFTPSCVVSSLDEDASSVIYDHFKESPSLFAEFYSGHFSQALHDYLCRDEAEGGIFPSLRSLKFSCNCTEDESPCSHVAAVLYGVGTLLDKDPSWLTRIRKIELTRSTPESAGILLDRQNSEESDLSALFAVPIG